MQGDADEENVGRPCMQIANPFDAPESIRCVHPAAEADDAEQREQGDHHPSTQWIVSAMTSHCTTNQRACISHCDQRCREE